MGDHSDTSKRDLAVFAACSREFLEISTRHNVFKKYGLHVSRGDNRPLRNVLEPEPLRLYSFPYYLDGITNLRPYMLHQPEWQYI